jgi:hypothetical protein
MDGRGYWSSRGGRLALKAIFVAVVIPLALWRRLRGADRLGLKMRPDAVSYWRSRDPQTRPVRLTEPF